MKPGHKGDHCGEDFPLKKITSDLDLNEVPLLGFFVLQIYFISTLTGSPPPLTGNSSAPILMHPHH